MIALDPLECSHFNYSKLSLSLRKHPQKISLICIGPLTNIALAIKMHPGIRDKICDVNIMGGNYKGLKSDSIHFHIFHILIEWFALISCLLNVLGVGNATACAEFNFHADPEAAHIVLNSLKCPINIVPWECCTKESINISKVIPYFHF